MVAQPLQPLWSPPLPPLPRQLPLNCRAAGYSGTLKERAGGTLKSVLTSNWGLWLGRIGGKLKISSSDDLMLTIYVAIVWRWQNSRCKVTHLFPTHFARLQIFGWVQIWNLPAGGWPLWKHSPIFTFSHFTRLVFHGLNWYHKIQMWLLSHGRIVGRIPFLSWRCQKINFCWLGWLEESREITSSKLEQIG